MMKKEGSLLTNFLLGLLIVSSFLIGVLYTKVRALEKSISDKESNQQVAGVQAAVNGGNQPVPQVTPTIVFEKSEDFIW